MADDHGGTNVEGIWSLGDVSSMHQLKHVANHEARVVAHNLAHPDYLRSRTQGRSYVTKSRAYGDTEYVWAMEDTTGICKVIADPASGEPRGAHLMGPQASNLIQPLIQGMSFGQCVTEIARGQYWINPALSEVVENALLGLELDPQ